MSSHLFIDGLGLSALAGGFGLCILDARRTIVHGHCINFPSSTEKDTSHLFERIDVLQPNSNGLQPTSEQIQIQSRSTDGRRGSSAAPVLSFLCGQGDRVDSMCGVASCVQQRDAWKRL